MRSYPPILADICCTSSLLKSSSQTIPRNPLDFPSVIKNTVDRILAHNLKRLYHSSVFGKCVWFFAHNVRCMYIFSDFPHKRFFPTNFFHIIIGRMPQDLFCLIELYDSSVLYKADLVCTFDSLIHIMGDKYNSFSGIPSAA